MISVDLTDLIIKSCAKNALEGYNFSTDIHEALDAEVAERLEKAAERSTAS